MGGAGLHDAGREGRARRSGTAGQRLDDPSGAVQVAAAEALARLGKLDVALPVLDRSGAATGDPRLRLAGGQRAGPPGRAARPALPDLKAALHDPPAGKQPIAEQQAQQLLQRIIDVLEGRRAALVYPAPQDK